MLYLEMSRNSTQWMLASILMSVWLAVKRNYFMCRMRILGTIFRVYSLFASLYLHLSHSISTCSGCCNSFRHCYKLILSEFWAFSAAADMASN